MHIEKTELEEVIILVPDLFKDERGFFMEIFQEERYRSFLGPALHFVQDNFSLNKKNVLRGLHYQAPPKGQAKLVQVLKGSVLDVVVDVRFGSPTFGQHIAVELSDENHRQLFVPVGFAHGFLAQSEEVLFMYKCTEFYSQEHERGVLWNDPALAITWGVSDPFLSSKDQELPLLSALPQEYVFKK